MFFTRIISTIRALNNNYNNGSYDLNPDWQRDRVWTSAERPAFIKSVRVDGVPIPEICLWQRPDNVEVSVDGKQRSISLFGFINDDFGYTVDDEEIWFSGLSEEEQDEFLDTEFSVLLFGPENTESEIIAYYVLRNSTSKALVAGEFIKAASRSPLVLQSRKSFDERKETITAAFGVKAPGKRQADLTNTVPYLASVVGGLENLTTSHIGISSVIARATQEQVNAVLPRFNAYLDEHIEICSRVLRENPDFSKKWRGFPPLGKVAAIWSSIVRRELMGDRDLNEFWSQFYRKLREHPAHALTWDTRTRKNVKVKQIVLNIEWVKLVVVTP